MNPFDPHTLTSIFYALLGGFLPTLVWLYFWTREDVDNPEPKGKIMIAFFGGIVAVFISLFLEKFAFGLDPNTVLSNSLLLPILNFIKGISAQQGVALNQVALVIVFAPIIEELSKFIFAYALAIKSKVDNEPIDPMIYMIATALGFSAVENMLFLIDPIIRNDFLYVIQTGDMRFVGATLLHTISSATIGIFISMKFFDKKFSKFLWTVIAVILAILIHSVFNFFMLGGTQSTFLALELIWLAVIIVLLAFERIKKIKLEKIA